MAAQLNDDDIKRLLLEPKKLSPDYRRQISLRNKKGHREAEIDVVGVNGSEFRLIFRQAIANPLDFSVILAYLIPKSNQVFRLLRCNGKHEHTNKLDNETFDGFHMHRATERYQDAGFKEDTYAVRTNLYSDYDGAIDCMLRTGGFGTPHGPQDELF